MKSLCEEARQGKCGPNDFPVIWLRRFLSAMEAEVVELGSEIPWKWWRSDKTADLPKLQEELIDIFHFLLSAIIVSGMQPQDFIRIFYQKRYINYRRQVVGRERADMEAMDEL